MTEFLRNDLERSPLTTGERSDGVAHIVDATVLGLFAPLEGRAGEMIVIEPRTRVDFAGC